MTSNKQTDLDTTEAARLGALRRLEIIGTEPDPHFNAVCALAQTFFKVPTVLISLIEEDHQWFKARCGFGSSGTSRDVSFCDHVIRSDEILVIEDASKDARFAANPLVTGTPGIRFYAGAPLSLKPGIRIGTICVIDLEPRTFSAEDRRKLVEFSTIVVGLLRLHELSVSQRKALADGERREAFMKTQAEEIARRAIELRETNRLLLLAEEMSNAGHWRFDLPSRRRVWSPQVYRIFGISPDAEVPDFAGTANGYHPDDLARVLATVNTAVSDLMPFALDARVCRPDGSIRHVEIRGICESGQDDATPYLFGVIIDVTDRKHVEQRLRDREHELNTVLDNMPAVIGYLNKDFRIRFANKRYREWYNKAPEEIAGVHVRDMIGEEHFRHNQIYMDAALQGHAQHFERRQSASRYVMASYIPDVKDGAVEGFFILVMDITDRKEAEDRLRTSMAFQDRAGRIAGIGSWELDLASKAVSFSDQTRLVHEIEPDFKLDHTTALGFYSPESRLVLENAIEETINAGKSWDIELPLTTAKGRSIWIRTTGEADFVGDKPVRIFGVFQDITNRRRAERQLRESETQYRLLAENSSDMIVRLDLSGTRVFVSPSSERLIGYTPDELVGTRPDHSIHPDDIPRFEAMRRSLIAGERQEDSITNRLRHKDGKYVWVEAKWRVVRDAEGRPTEFVASVRNVSARREAEERLQASESLYRTLADALPQMVWVVRASDRTALYANERYHAYYGPIGTGRDERIKRNHPDDVEHMEATWRKAAAEGRTFDVEGRLRRHDGVYRWHKVIASPVTRDGIIVEWLGTALDIDDIIVGRQTLKETSDLLSLSQDAAGAGFFDLDLVKGTVVLSGQSVAMHGLGDGDAIDIDLDGWRACVDPDDAARVLDLVDQACVERKTYSGEFRVLKDGKPARWIHGIGRAQYDHTGRAVRMIGLNFDVTERKSAESKLIEAIEAAEAARREAEKASAAKSDFLASMSHEIRTPLNSIIGYTDLLLEQGRQDSGDRRKLDLGDRRKLDSGDRRKLELIKDSGSALLTIVSDILDFSKIEAGEIDLDPVPFSLSSLVETVLAMVSGFTGATRLNIQSELAEDLPASVYGDVGRLRQILLNLLNNAVKFTAEGTVKLVVVREAADPDSCRLRFVVMDTGIGIGSDRRERLFQRFSQMDGSIARRFGGTGLGLAICKSLVERMGGDIGVASTEGLGSSFWFTLNLPIVAATAGTTELSSKDGRPMTPVRILLVDDVVVNQDLARMILEAGGHHVEVASNGIDAIRMARRGRFDLVLMDVQMPGMDGLTATRHIRALDEPIRSVPIVALTANVLPQQIAAFRAVGMNDHIGKPFKRTELYDSVARWARQPPISTPLPWPTSRPTLDHGVLDELREMVGEEVCGTLMQKFFTEMDDRLKNMRGDADRERLAADAHALISPAGSLGFTGFSDLCRKIELTARQGGDLEACVAALAHARDMIIIERDALF